VNRDRGIVSVAAGGAVSAAKRPPWLLFEKNSNQGAS
jgi:hypothetical protein